MYEEREVSFRFGSGMSPMVRKLIIITVVFFVLQLVLGLIAKEQNDFLVIIFALKPVSAIFGLEIWRFITYAFLHGGAFHVLFNMLGLYFFGPDIERNLGSQKHFLFFYLTAAVVGGLCQTGLAFALGGKIPFLSIIGASGALMAVIVAAALYTPNRIVILFIFPIKLKYLALMFIGVDIISVLQEARFGSGNVARLAHLGGAGFGFLYIKFLPRIKEFIQNRKEAAQISLEKQDENNEREMDRLLAKVHEKGMSSLTEKERRFLMEQSEK
ncbi:rhomboid family intramembrane serine protease [Planctomycetota bacterium]